MSIPSNGPPHKPSLFSNWFSGGFSRIFRIGAKKKAGLDPKTQEATKNADSISKDTFSKTEASGRKQTTYQVKKSKSKNEKMEQLIVRQLEPRKEIGEVKRQLGQTTDYAKLIKDVENIHEQILQNDPKLTDNVVNLFNQIAQKKINLPQNEVELLEDVEKRLADHLQEKSPDHAKQIFYKLLENNKSLPEGEIANKVIDFFKYVRPIDIDTSHIPKLEVDITTKEKKKEFITLVNRLNEIYQTESKFFELVSMFGSPTESRAFFDLLEAKKIIEKPELDFFKKDTAELIQNSKVLLEEMAFLNFEKDLAPLFEGKPLSDETLEKLSKEAPEALQKLFTLLTSERFQNQLNLLQAYLPKYVEKEEKLRKILASEEGIQFQKEFRGDNTGFEGTQILAAPMQRVSRYILLLSDLKKDLPTEIAEHSNPLLLEIKDRLSRINSSVNKLEPNRAKSR